MLHDQNTGSSPTDSTAGSSPRDIRPDGHMVRTATPIVVRVLFPDHLHGEDSIPAFNISWRRFEYVEVIEAWLVDHLFDH